MANTTNFGWETPDDTDLVKDGAAAMRTLGNAIDTSLVDLKGGTTNQVLAKNSNTDMDFKWVETDDTNAIQNAIVDAKGDLIAASAADTPARLAVGSDGDTLVADSSTTTGLRWQSSYGAGKNSILNSSFEIDQRNAGASVTPTNTQYTLDRWAASLTAASKFSVQRNAGSVTPPSGFSNYLGVTSLSAYTLGANDTFGVYQHIEGSNVAHYGFGTSAAKTVTLSFWVRSSLTGTFSGSFNNSANNYAYIFTYTISASNTWEYKTVTIPGATAGTWLTGSNIGLMVYFNLGVSGTYSNAAGNWTTAGSKYGLSTAVSVVSTNAATWYITGVQLEIGNTGTGYTLAGGNIAGELAACQRYYYKLTASAAGNNMGVGFADSTTSAVLVVPFKVSMRTSPTALETSGTAGDYSIRQQGAVSTTLSGVPTFSSASTDVANINAPVASGLTAGNGVAGRAVNSSAYLAWSAEL